VQKNSPRYPKIKVARDKAHNLWSYHRW